MDEYKNLTIFNKCLINIYKIYVNETKDEKFSWQFYQIIKFDPTLIFRKIKPIILSYKSNILNSDFKFLWSIKFISKIENPLILEYFSLIRTLFTNLDKEIKLSVEEELKKLVN